MNFLKKLPIAIALAAGLGASNASTFGDYDPLAASFLGALADPNTPTGDPFVVSTTDPIAVTFLGHTAGYSNTLMELAFNGTLFNNDTSAIGDTVVIGGLTPGVLIFELKVDRNGDGIMGADDYVLQSGTAFTKLIDLNNGQFLLGFEDILRDGLVAGDKDYNDMVFKVGAIPEPSTYALMLAGIAVVGFVARRRKAV